MSKHTPGPWHFSGIEYIYAHDPSPSYLASSRVVAAVYSSELAGGDDEKQANGRLIAAAHETAAERDRLREINAELLVHLINMRAYAMMTDRQKNDRVALELDLEAAFDTIAKAQGRS